jgi:cytochrome c peroxidase
MFCTGRGNRVAARLAAPFLAACFASCGGGSESAGSLGNPPPPTTPDPPPTQRHAPELARANGTQVVVVSHAFSYDPTQGGATFTDADGDALTYEILLRRAESPAAAPEPPAGVRVEGTLVVGTLEEIGAIIVTITARDPTGDTATDEFAIRVDPNGSPYVLRPNDDVIVAVGDVVDIEASRGGMTFADPEGDSLIYELTLRGQPRGLLTSGSRVSGQFDSIGLVEVTIHARDPFGGEGSDTFLVAAPAAEPGVPTLPDPPFVYSDTGLSAELPYMFRDASDDTVLDDNRTTDAGAALGRVLFHDRRLSITNTVSCASCHLQSHGFATPERFPTGSLGVPLKRNAMALGNVRYNAQRSWFSDMRVHRLEELALQPIENAEELGSPLELAEAKLRAASFYPGLFEAAFGTPAITRERVGLALGQFLQSLMTYRSRHDLAFNPMENEPYDPTPVLTAQELRGFQIFDDNPRTRCNSCHDLRLGTNRWQANNGIDLVPTDPGTLIPALQRDGSVGVFRAASLRNIAVTGPYMHDGRFATLRDVIDHYDHGIQDSANLDGILRSLSGGPVRMNFTEQEKDDLEAFFRAMTDEAFLTDPKFSSPFPD